MFRINESREAVRRIQTYLHFIRDRKHNEIPLISPDGFYGEETRNAVKIFQKLYGIVESRIVDIETNNQIYKVFLETIETRLLSQFEVGEFPVSLGSKGKVVFGVNDLLLSLRERYIDMPRTNYGEYFGESTKDAVMFIEEIFGYESTGVVDASLYNRMVREVNAFKNI